MDGWAVKNMMCLSSTNQRWFTAVTLGVELVAAGHQHVAAAAENGETVIVVPCIHAVEEVVFREMQR